MGLPVLVVYGAIVWKVLLVLLISLSLVLLAWWRQFWEVRLGQVTGLRQGAVLLRGRIAKGSATTTVKRDVAANQRSDELVLDLEGEQVVIAGEVDVEVQHGSSEVSSFFRRSHTRTVRAGDEVYVAATAARSGGDGATYREASVAWTLDGVTRLAAVRPAPQPVLGRGCVKIGENVTRRAVPLLRTRSIDVRG
ncbi:MAG: hypothetical protein KIT31_16395 [Deltaproteobacteria bacterium]|nr:hypothetical protein [Deltaproteobacteria bacterium]